MRRRDQLMFRRLFTMVLAVVAATSLIAGCSGNASTNAPDKAVTITPDGQAIRTILGIKDGESAGAGEEWDVGAVLAMSGYGSFYGTTESTGLDLALQQIQEAGGPKINVTYKDNKSGDATAGVTGLRTLASDGVGLVFTDYIGDLGALFQPLESYKIMALDGGGGTGGFGRSKPYFYGPRSETPGDAFPGILQYAKETMPSVRRVAMAAQDFGDSNDVQIANFKAAVEAAGLEFADYEIVAGGTTDYSSVISKLLASSPDLIIPSMYGTDAGLFSKQYVSTGSAVPTIGADFNSDSVEAGGPTFAGYTFAAEYFDATNPANNWAKIAADAFQKRYDKPMTNFAANFYEDAFIAWQLYRDVKASGGDVNSGADLVAAMEARPSFMSVYGGSSTKPGELRIDLQTHSVDVRSMGVYQWDGTKIIPKATFGIGGAGFALAK